ncbi:hemolysin-type calcium-binding region [Vibrio ishigakensis]|uniref:Hemolysin-type calcium-binding region n=1 Tax=Vibrio ishigakensis TaxID=1481914 RepID=A0A0B8QAL7_9VIBR|nr:hemolysin-type calcium-binding region [Vibrio ishigakensis]
MIGLMAALSDIGEALSIEVRGLDANAVVEATAGSVALDNGVWVLDEAALATAVVKYTSSPGETTVSFDVVAVSKELDGNTELDSADSQVISYAAEIVADGTDLDASLEAEPTTIVDGDGDTVLTGSDNDDELIGGEGNDTLIGGLGSDILTGGGGADLFVFNEIDNTKEDVITDFSVTEGDSIDLAGIFSELDSNLDLDSLLQNFAASQELTATQVGTTDDVKIELDTGGTKQSILVKDLYSQLDNGGDLNKDLLTTLFENNVIKYDGS